MEKNKLVSNKKTLSLVLNENEAAALLHLVSQAPNAYEIYNVYEYLKNFIEDNTKIEVIDEKE